MSNVENGLGLLDIVVFAIYVAIIIGVGLWVSRDKKGAKKSTEDYFLAGKSLPWWAVGASLIAANISAEQFIGMSGSGFSIGLAIASYEWMAAITLIIVGKYFLPIFIEKGIYTIPEFVEKRFNKNLKTILAIFWIGLYIFVNLTSVLYLGGLALETILGIPLMYSIIGLALFALVYSIYGGLSAVVWTDVIQVFFLVLGGLMTTWMAVSFIGGDGGFLSGFDKMYQAAPDHFNMILDQSNPQFMNLPGIAVLIGGLWVANLYYWGFNQYIIQRTLAAKSVAEAQKGILFAAFLKLIVPFLVVIPGIAAYVITQSPELMSQMGAMAMNNLPTAAHADKAYPWLTQFLPAGVKGVVFAALAAAIVSSLASMLNSTATIFTMDIYKAHIAPNTGDHQLVNVGRISAIAALIIACLVAPMLGGIGQAFQYIQEYTGLVSPGILAVFMLGLFWKKTTSRGAIIGVVASIPFALFLKFMPLNMPFMDQMLYTLLFTIVVIAFTSLSTSEQDDDSKAIKVTAQTFKTERSFNVAAYAIVVVLAVLYALFW
ncbi:sodium/sugar symporter [Escherichia coli]|jgi:SSS family solute:Na+ symporter|uniref:Sodium/sugar symporter n=2 Tax=Enterobacteriaceae TaxID=543 RepID=A0A8T3UPK0_ECOLX|nr:MULTISPECIES: sodium/sugar symporter [Enterobacteriaceae]EAA3687579.1 sodium/glucose cotransporter [Salmonella enterica subsp. enterica serovar Kedougou]EAM8521098.1 sodium/glucose cotransporter [Salmonella enterica]NCC19621.1 sodium/glucose cotransporter [Candidatus Saccharibacteria bacterium]HDS8944298.1 sodium/sugar symporter [Klebsiella pneumoniae subsp. ozaenae]EAQ6126306.1 sodium/glucose cotransporter [Salmonella enterica]